MNCKVRVVHQPKNETLPCFPIVNARVMLTKDNEAKTALTGEDGWCEFIGLAEAQYTLECAHFGSPAVKKPLTVAKGKPCGETIELDLGFDITLLEECDCELRPVATATAGKRLVLRLSSNSDKSIASIVWRTPGAQGVQSPTSKSDYECAAPTRQDFFSAEPQITEKADGQTPPAYTTMARKVPVLPAQTHMVQGDINVVGRVAVQEPVNVRLQRTASDPTLDQALWVAIRNRTRAMSFDRYQKFMNRALLWEEQNPFRGLQTRAAQELGRDVSELGTHLHGVTAYQKLKALTETFLLLQCGVRIDERGEQTRIPFDEGMEARRLGGPFSIDDMEARLKDYLGDRAQLPYITRVAKAAFPELERDSFDDRLIASRINEPLLIELIWSYWMEEGMLVQTMNALSLRFQNVHSAGERDPLMNLEIDPLRPLNNLLWGYIQDEVHRLTVRRRAYEYTHHYGLTVYGKAASGMRPADTRSKFLEAFHNLLFQTSVFFKEDFQTTVIADGFPLLNSLREVHLILSQGAQNQFGDLPWTARVEMMLSQYMLSRREIHDFLGARVMVPYREPWEAQVDAMKSLQGWTDVTVSHFRDLAVYGEQLLLSIRYGDWIADNDEYSAINWARYFRPEIQGYLHAYRAVTGIDLTNADSIDATIPGILLQKRAAMQQRAR